MFSFFRRKKQSAPPDQRALYRHPLVDPTAIAIRLENPAGPPVSAEVVDMTIRGVGLRMAIEIDPVFAQDIALNMEIHNPHDGWTITTPVVMRQRRPDGDRFAYYGFEFANQGNLFAQMEDRLGRFFNRRRGRRVPLDVIEPPYAHVSYKALRLRGPIVDISRGGFQISVPHVEAVQLETHQTVQLRFELPTARKSFEGLGDLKYRHSLGPRDLLGFEFDFDPEGTLAERRDEINEYVAVRTAELEAMGFVQSRIERDEPPKPRLAPGPGDVEAREAG